MANEQPSSQGFFAVGRVAFFLVPFLSGGLTSFSNQWAEFNFQVYLAPQVDIKKSENLNELDTITFPISGKKGDREYQNNNKFMPLIGSPGVAFIVVDDPPGTSANAVFNSVLSGWPVLVLTLLMALLSGIVMWGLVSVQSRT